MAAVNTNTQPRPRSVPRPPFKWSPSHYVTAYCAAATGLTRDAIATTLDVNRATLRTWCRMYPALAEAIDRGQADARRPIDRGSLRDYIYGHLDPEARSTWDALTIAEHGDALPAGDRCRAIIEQTSDVIHQQLYLYALIYTGHNVNEAMSKVGLSKRTFDRWVTTDPGFATLLDDVQYYKENYYISAFDAAVDRGEVAAVVHAVKTVCAHRGYSEKFVVEHSGTVRHDHHAEVDIFSLPLSNQCKREILDAIRARDAADDMVVNAIHHRVPA